MRIIQGILRCGLRLNYVCTLTIAILLAHSVQSEEVIKIGMSTALTGPAKALGQGMKLGIEAYFNKVNSAGGINGKKIKLIALDDGYEPSRTAPNMRTLIDEHKVLAVIGNVGTPTAVVSVPIANEKKTVLFGAFTGAGVLRKSPPDRYVINYRASYAEETAAMIDGLLKIGVKPKEIAFFTQNDAYGDAGYQGAIKALKAKGFSEAERLAHGRYTRNTLNVENGFGLILDAEIEPKAIIMVGAYAPCAEFIKLAKEELPGTLFLNVSFVGSTALAKALGDKGDGVIITQVVPHFESDLPLVKQYRNDIKHISPQAIPGFASLEGYIAANIFVSGMKPAKSPLTRESIVDGIESIHELDIGIGANISFSKNEHQASHKVWPTMIKDGNFITFEWNNYPTPNLVDTK